MTEPLKFFPAYQARRLPEIQRQYVERFNAAETQQQLRNVTDDYHRALALIGIGPDDMGNHGCIIPPAANVNANQHPRPASIPPARRLRRAGFLMAAAGGFFALSWVYVLIAMVSVLTYYPRRAYRRITGK